jgi:hypothetical protein
MKEAIKNPKNVVASCFVLLFGFHFYWARVFRYHSLPSSFFLFICFLLWCAPSLWRYLGKIQTNSAFWLSCWSRPIIRAGSLRFILFIGTSRIWCHARDRPVSNYIPVSSLDTCLFFKLSDCINKWLNNCKTQLRLIKTHQKIECRWCVYL